MQPDRPCLFHVITEVFEKVDIVASVMVVKSNMRNVRFPMASNHDAILNCI